MLIAALRGGNDFRHSVEDDLESTFYCVLYFAIRALPYSTRSDIGNWMFQFFDEHIRTDQEGTVKGGITKSYFRSEPELFTDEFKFDNVEIERWFNTAYSYLTTALPGYRKANIPLLWEPINVQELFSSMREKDLPENDRKDHDVPKIVLDNGLSYQATRISTRVRPKDITEPAVAESSRTRNKRLRVEINEKHGESVNGEMRESKKRKGRTATLEKCESAAEGDDQVSRGKDAGALNLRRSTRSSTRSAGVCSTTTVEKHETTAKENGHASRGKDAGALNLRRSTRSSTRSAGASSRKR